MSTNAFFENYKDNSNGTRYGGLHTRKHVNWFWLAVKRCDPSINYADIVEIPMSLFPTLAAEMPRSLFAFHRWIEYTLAEEADRLGTLGEDGFHEILSFITYGVREQEHWDHCSISW